jgi:hypothetical protein
MEAVRTPAYVSTVGDDRTITLPDDIPAGATVAVFVLPPKAVEAEVARQARFAAMLDAIRAAIASGESPPEMSDEELDARIERARRAAS